MSTSRTNHRAFSLIECMIVVIMLSIVVPITSMFLDQRASQRADAVQALRASTLAQAVLEHVLADASSNAPGRGYAAFANANTYLNDPATGLYSRIASMLNFYDNMGVTCVVTISSPVSISGSATGVPAQDLFRIVTVQVSAPTSRGIDIDVALETMVTDL